MPNATEPVSRVLAEAGLPQPWRTLDAERPRAGEVVEVRPWGMSGILRARFEPARGEWVPVNPVLKPVLTTGSDKWRPLPPEATVQAETSLSRQDVLERAERRERIATAVLAAQAGNAPVVALGGPNVDNLLVSTSIGLANLLISALDLERDAELAEARS